METSQLQPWMFTTSYVIGNSVFFISLEGKWRVFWWGKGGRVLIGKMTANFLPGHNDLFKIFNDSGSEHEFEGYDPEDLEEDFVQQQFYGLSIGV